MPNGMGSNPVEDMDVCKLIVPSRHGGSLNSRRDDQGSTHLGPPMRKREGEKWTAPHVLKGLEKPKKKENEGKSSKKTRAGRFGKRSKEDPGVLNHDADQES
ncbi:hypothetical protein TNCV_699531 [Trichonephila clavipes]|nr:hypothetical protein TNCV_699531 [Trichonephila clavipes]